MAAWIPLSILAALSFVAAGFTHWREGRPSPRSEFMDQPEDDHLQVWRQVFADLLQARKQGNALDFDVRSLERIPVVTHDDARAQMEAWGHELWATVQQGPPALAAEFYAAIDEASNNYGSLLESQGAAMVRRLNVWRTALQRLIDKFAARHRGVRAPCSRLS